MSETPGDKSEATKRKRAPGDESAELVVEESRGISLVWLIPLVALFIGLWLAYKTLSEEGPTVTITFKEAGGLEAGKTKVKYKDVEVGTVQAVNLSSDLSHVIVVVKLDKHVESQLGEATKFWVVQPHLGLGGVSGLDTLIAGHYIGVEFAKGKYATKFNGLDRPPKISADTPGKRFVLVATDAGSLTDGTPVYFHEIQVGRVVEVKLSQNRDNVEVEIFIDAPFDGLVKDSTKFWQTSGIDLSMNSQGVNLKVGSLLTLLGGGIGFETRDLGNPETKPSEAGKEFALYKDYASIAEGAHVYKQYFLLYFDDSVRGLARGAPVELRGIRVGEVTEFWFSLDPVTNNIRIPVTIAIDADRVMPPDQFARLLESRKGELNTGRRPIMEKLIERGLRARLKTGSLVTGQLYVDLDFYPDQPEKTMIYGGKFPEIPTLPSLTEQFQNDVKEILAKLKSLPLDKIGEEILGTVKGTNRLLNSPDLHSSIASLNTALKDLHQLTQTADREVVKITTHLEKSLGSTAKILEQLEPGTPMAVDLRNALEELAASARSIRALTDYLERHPEALLHGKSGAK